MKSILAAASILVFLSLPFIVRTPRFGSGAMAAVQADQQPEDLEQFRAQAEEGIKHVLVSQVEAWNRKDLKGFMDGYWHSPDLTFFSGGNESKGWNAALQRYQQRYQSKGKEMGKLDFQDLNIDVLGRQAAFVRGSWHLTMPDGKQPHGLFTLVFKKMPGGWKIVHDHTSSAE
jgi:beta-aspartyl-peptidase (threonine type)